LKQLIPCALGIVPDRIVLFRAPLCQRHGALNQINLVFIVVTVESRRRHQHIDSRAIKFGARNQLHINHLIPSVTHGPHAEEIQYLRLRYTTVGRKLTGPENNASFVGNFPSWLPRKAAIVEFAALIPSFSACSVGTTAASNEKRLRPAGESLWGNERIVRRPRRNTFSIKSVKNRADLTITMANVCCIIQRLIHQLCKLRIFFSRNRSNSLFRLSLLQ